MNYYYSLNDYFKETYGEKIYKIAIDAGLTCPNRDGKIDTRGCIFCSAGGSGDFAVAYEAANLEVAGSGIKAQLAKGQLLFGDKHIGNHFIAYFQAYTNTYAPTSYLEEIYTAALTTPEVCGISIATRPDCLPPDVIALLEKLHQEFFLSKEKAFRKFIWIELGLQTIHEKTADYIRRGYKLSVFDNAVNRLNAIGIPVITHVILGLPGETKSDCIETIHYLNQKGIFGIKLQLLHVLQNTDLYTDYAAGKFSVLSKEDYMDVLVECVGNLSPDIVIRRLTGDGPKDILAAPDWSRNKRDVLNTFHHQMKIRNIRQGKLII